MRKFLAAGLMVLGGGMLALAAGSGPSAPPPLEIAGIERARAGDAVRLPHKSRGQRAAEYLRERGFSKDAAIIAISTLPVIELRGAIPVGHLLYHDRHPGTRLGRDDWARAGRIFVYAVLGNMLPVPFILLLLGPLSNLGMKIPLGKRFFNWLFARTRRKTADIEKYETLGLTIFVAIPLPATGAWTGAMAAWLLGMSFLHSLLAIFFGVLIAGVIMTVLAMMGWIGAAIAGVVLTVFFCGVLAKTFQSPSSSAAKDASAGS